MNDATTMTKPGKHAGTTVHPIVQNDSELYTIGIYTTAVFASAIGIWGIMCVTSAILENDGPLQLLSSLSHAISGV